jgi:hypothetical protein
VKQKLKVMKNNYLHLYSFLFFFSFALSASSGNTHSCTQENEVQVTETTSAASQIQQSATHQFNDSISKNDQLENDKCGDEEKSEHSESFKDKNDKTVENNKPKSALGILITLIKMLFGNT